MPVKYTAADLAATVAGRLPSNADALGVSAQGKQSKRVTRADIAPYRSKTEVRYAALLDLRVKIGVEVVKWEYEPEKLTLAHRCTLAPDFRVTFLGGRVEWHEVKGAFIREDAWIKLKVAAAMYPDQVFVMMQWKGGQWIRKEMPKE